MTQQSPATSSGALDSGGRMLQVWWAGKDTAWPEHAVWLQRPAPQRFGTCPLLQDWKVRMLFPPPLATGWFWSPPPPRLAMRLPGRVPPCRSASGFQKRLVQCRKVLRQW